MAFTYPFCYKPIPEIVSTAKELMRKIASEPELDEIFSEGKMLGVLMVAEKGENGTAGVEKERRNEKNRGERSGADGGQEEKEMTGGEKIECGGGGGNCEDEMCGDLMDGVQGGNDGITQVDSSQRSDGSGEQAGGGVKFLYAFSGLAGGRSIIDGFVPPIFDLNAPGSEYRAREAEISELNRWIRELESGDCEHIDASAGASKSSSAAGTPNANFGAPTQAEEQGHFDKRCAPLLSIHWGTNPPDPLTPLGAPTQAEEQGHFDKLNDRNAEAPEAGCAEKNTGLAESRKKEILASLKTRRRELSISLQDWLFRQYRVLNARGEWSSIREIFERRGIMPPGGTGDCAAPKLLQYAYLHNLQPLALGEFWYGTPPLRELRLQGCFYPACTGKCGPLLEYMMQGLDVEPNPLERDDSEFTAQLVIYSDDDIVVANKPAGMLSVPGRTASNSLLTLLRRRFGEDLQSCHRLDMDTSGVMVFARGLRNKSLIEKQFAEHSARKTYVARLISLPAAGAANAGVDSGRIELPLIVD